MKKIFSLVLALVFLCSLPACTPSTEPTHTAPFENLISNVDGFKSYLDLEGYVQGITQDNFINIIDKFSLDGKKLTEISPTESYVKDNEFGFRSYVIGEENGKNFDIRYSCKTFVDGSEGKNCEFKTEYPFEGVTLPYGITFEDTMESALVKLGIDMDFNKDFVADEGYEKTDEEFNTAMTVYKNGGQVLVLYDFNRTNSPAEYAFPYAIHFTEEYTVQDEENGSTKISRSIFLRFGDGFFEEEKLGKFEIIYNES